MEKQVDATILCRRDTNENWVANDPVLAEGEAGYNTTNKRFKIGDGINKWSDLPYITVGKLDTTRVGEIFNDYNNNIASGNYSHAEGYKTTSSGESSHAEGNSVTASGSASHAEGYVAKAIGTTSHAEGYSTTASASYTHAEGYSSKAIGITSHAEGESSTANGRASHTEGGYTVTGTNASYAHAEGNNTAANGNCSHTEGYKTTALGKYTHAEGFYTYSGFDGSHTEGVKSSTHIYMYNTKTGTFGTNTCELINSTGIEEGQKYYLYYKNDSDEIECITGTITSKNGNVITLSHVPKALSELFTSHDDSTIYNGSIIIDGGETGPVEAKYSGNNYSAHAEGSNTFASVNAHAEGYKTKAYGFSSHTEGDSTAASGLKSHAEGYLTTADGNSSHAEGYSTYAVGEGSHAEGYETTADGNSSHAEGKGTSANGDYSHAEGHNTITNGESSHAEGTQTTAVGLNTHAEGYETYSSYPLSHTEGEQTSTKVYGYKPISVNGYTITLSSTENINVGDSLILFYIDNTTNELKYYHSNVKSLSDTQIVATAALTNAGTYTAKNTDSIDGMLIIAGGEKGEVLVKESLDSNNYSAHAEGSNTFASVNAHAEGYKTKAYGFSSHTEGINTSSSGEGSHAEGYETVASGQFSHTEGHKTTASGTYSHSEGYNTTASGTYSHSEGNSTNAKGTGAHAEGYATNANGEGSHSEGKGTLSFISSHAEGERTRSNNISHSEGYLTIAIGYATHSENRENTALAYGAHAEGIANMSGFNSFGVSAFDNDNCTYTLTSVDGITTSSKLIVSVNGLVRSMNVLSVDSETKIVSVDPNRYIPVNTDTFPSLNRDNFVTCYPIIERTGSHPTNFGDSAFAINDAPQGTHSEGGLNFALGQFSHAEGYKNISAGYYSHAEGESCHVNGKSSHTEGGYTIASSDYQHVQGKYNIEDIDNTYAHIVGNGTSETSRSNAHTIDWNGNAWFSGTVTVGTDNKELATKEYVDTLLSRISVLETQVSQLMSIINTDGMVLNGGPAVSNVTIE